MITHRRSPAFLSPASILIALAGTFIGIGTIGTFAGCAHKRAPARTPQASDADLPGQPRGLGLYVQAVEAYHRGDNAAAISKLQRATDRNPDLINAHSLLGDLYREQGNYEQAAAQYEAAARLDPYGTNNQFRLGLGYQLLNRSKDAAAAYLRALELDPKNVQANIGLGLVYLALNQVDDSIKYLRKATELDPNSAVAWANLGAALDIGGDAAAAERAYRRSLELNGLQDSTLLNLGLNLIAQRKATEAVSVMEQVVKRMDTPATHRAYGEALALAGRFDEAVQQFDTALKQDPRYYPALNAKGEALIHKYQKGLELDESLRASAIDTWKKSLAMNSHQPRIQQLIKDWTGTRIFGAR